MSVAYGKFELPEKIKVEEVAPNVARFTAEPFERGFGHTLGNSLRRILLSSLEAPAIISIAIEGVPHEYMAVEGIVEDMTNICLNAKGALLRKLPTGDELHAREQRVISKILDISAEDLEKTGQFPVTLGYLVQGSNFEVVNPNLHLFTVTRPMTKRVDLRVCVNRGYIPSEKLSVPHRSTDEILIDGCFSPVRLVNYFVENTRVGQDTDYDRLILEVTTDGRVSPKEAFSYATQIGMKHFEVFDKLHEHMLTFEESRLEGDSARDALMHSLSMGINEIELSVRSTNCLDAAGIRYIGQLVVQFTKDKLLSQRNFGKKSLSEIEEKLTLMGLGLGQDLTHMGITPENVLERINTYLKETQAKES